MKGIQHAIISVLILSCCHNPKHINQKEQPKPNYRIQGIHSGIDCPSILLNHRQNVFQPVCYFFWQASSFRPEASYQEVLSAIRLQAIVWKYRIHNKLSNLLQHNLVLQDRQDSRQLNVQVLRCRVLRQVRIQTNCLC